MAVAGQDAVDEYGDEAALVSVELRKSEEDESFGFGLTQTGSGEQVVAVLCVAVVAPLHACNMYCA